VSSKTAGQPELVQYSLFTVNVHRDKGIGRCTHGLSTLPVIHRLHGKALLNTGVLHWKPGGHNTLEAGRCPNHVC
jgi:hypothetical protein